MRPFPLHPPGHSYARWGYPKPNPAPMSAAMGPPRLPPINPRGGLLQPQPPPVPRSSETLMVSGRSHRITFEPEEERFETPAPAPGRLLKRSQNKWDLRDLADSRDLAVGSRKKKPSVDKRKKSVDNSDCTLSVSGKGLSKKGAKKVKPPRVESEVDLPSLSPDMKVPTPEPTFVQSNSDISTRRQKKSKKSKEKTSAADALARDYTLSGERLTSKEVPPMNHYLFGQKRRVFFIEPLQADVPSPTPPDGPCCFLSTHK